jgi:glyoxylase-like metal-dependent hydrolase (beta-lactamase superfamily II)
LPGQVRIPQRIFLATMRDSGDIRITRLEVGDYGNNCYVLIDPSSQTSAIIDAPAEADRILDAVANTTVSTVVITHGHSDHWGALIEVAEKTGAIVAAHTGDADSLPVKPGRLLADGETVTVGAVPLGVLHTPGHTPGSICVVFGGHLFTGDTLFPGGPGHSASADALRQSIESITRKLFALPPETIVYPGHGDGTTIQESRIEYSVFAANSHPPDLHGDVLWKES